MRPQDTGTDNVANVPPNVRLQARGACAASPCKPLLADWHAATPANGKRRPSPHDDFADLNDWTLVGVVWNVSHDLLSVWTEPSLKSLN